jgi:hypothetical protein
MEGGKIAKPGRVPSAWLPRTSTPGAISLDRLLIVTPSDHWK